MRFRGLAMTIYILMVIVLLSLLGGGVVWLTHIIIKAERSKVLETAIELTRDTDRRLGVACKASDEDLCRELGGVTNEQGVCE